MNSIVPGSALNLAFKQTGGNIQVTGDYSSTDGIFTIQPGKDQKFNILSLSIDMRLTGNLDVTKYGLQAALSAGILIYSEPSFDTDLFSPIIIKTNQDLEKWFVKENKMSDAVYMGEYRFFMKFGKTIQLKHRKDKPPDKLIIKSTENLTTHFASSTCSFMAHGNWEGI